jgi:hypothetical protein
MQRSKVLRPLQGFKYLKKTFNTNCVGMHMTALLGNKMMFGELSLELLAEATGFKESERESKKVDFSEEQKAMEDFCRSKISLDLSVKHITDGSSL